MFAPSEVYRYSNEEYKINKHSGAIVNYIEDYYSHAWFVTEIPIGYDPGIDYTNNIVLRFKIENNTESTVKLNSEFSFETKTATANAQQVNSSELGNGMYKFLKKGQKFLSKVPDVNKLDEYYEKINKGLDPARYSGHSKLQEVVDKTRKIITGKDLRNILTFTSSVATSISGPLGAGISLFSSLFFKSNSQAMQLVQVMPTVSTGTGIISGEIFTSTNATSFPLQLPGSNHNYPNGEVNIDVPVYDKPLGVISLERTPRLAQFSKVLDSYVIQPNYNERETDFDFAMKGYEYITYQLADYVNLALNTYSDAGIVDIKARLLARHYLPYSLSDSRTKHITSKIETGEYELIENNKEWFIYGTPLTDIKNFRNIELILYRGTHITHVLGPSFGREERVDNPIYLQLLVTLKPENPIADQTYIVHNMTYNLDKNRSIAWSSEGRGNALVLSKY